MNKRTKKEQGFTIIEVVLVLAIAALIMLMVFIAWPALQRSQRDGARKQDAQTIASALGTYKGNNSGSITGISQANFVGQYVQNLGQYDPGNATTAKDITIRAAVTGTPGAAVTGMTSANASVVWVTPGATCNGNNIVVGTSRQATVTVWLEAAGGSQFCVGA